MEAEKIETKSKMYGPGRLGPIVIVWKVGGKLNVNSQKQFYLLVEKWIDKNSFCSINATITITGPDYSND